MPWTAYHIMPIDFGWEMLPTLQDVAAQLARSEAEDALPDREIQIESGVESLANFMNNFEQAKQLAKAEGWESEYRDEPRVFWLPDENKFSYAFVWKQDNNGSTFVVSPRPLNWLAEL